MVLTAPQTPSDVHEPEPRPIDDLVIKEAKQRARLRRRRYAATAGVIGLLFVAVLALFASRDAPPTGRAESGAGEGAAAVGPDARAARLVDSYGIVHVGWVAAYADGRIIWHRESASYGTLGNLAERRLNAAGMARVRAHAIDWTVFLRDPANALPPAAWAEPAARPHVPSAYAVCLEWVAAGFTSSRALAVRHVPTPARDVLEGRPLARGAFISRHDPPLETFSLPNDWNCIEVDRAGIAALARTSTLEFWGGTSRGITFFRYPDGSTDIARILPVLPHGEFDPAGG